MKPYDSRFTSHHVDFIISYAFLWNPMSKSLLYKKTSTAINQKHRSQTQGWGNFVFTEQRRHHHVQAQVKLVSVQQQGPFLVGQGSEYKLHLGWSSYHLILIPTLGGHLTSPPSHFWGHNELRKKKRNCLGMWGKIPDNITIYHESPIS